MVNKTTAFVEKIKEETKKGGEEVMLVPKIVYGTDRFGNKFIYFKVKDFTNNRYWDEPFVLMYQNPKVKKQNVVENQMKLIIDMIKRLYHTSSEKSFERPSVHFFIKGKKFSAKPKIESYYVQLVRTLLYELAGVEGFSVKGEVFEYHNSDLLTLPALLNHEEGRKNDNTQPSSKSKK